MTGAGGQPVVLVVDDLPANRRLMEAILAPHGYHVVEAESGEDALEILTEGQTDLVLLDLLMPGLDGHETCKRIRANPDTAYLPVVMVTASGPAEKVRAIDTGADDFISKPLDQAELLGRVRSLLRVKRYHDTVVTQAAELAQWNEELEGRVAAQVRQLERFGALRRFFSPQITRLLLETVDAVRGVLPETAPLIVRISGTDWIDGGWDLEQSTRLAVLLKERGVDLIDVSSGGNAPASIPVEPGYQVPLSAGVREAGIPTGAVGLITEPEQAEKIVANGEADVVLLARAALRESAWPLRAAHELGVPNDDAPWPDQYLRARWR